MVNFSQIQFVAQQPCGKQLHTCPGRSSDTTGGTRVGNKDPVLQILGICVLVTDC